MAVPPPRKAAADQGLSLERAFGAFEADVRASLEQEARRSVDEALQRISHSGGPYRITSFEFDIVIRDVNVSLSTTQGSQAEHTAAPRRRAKRKPAARPAGATGRPPGPVRTALTEIFASADSELTTDDIREQLDQRGVETTSDNLNQQLRRLSASGTLERVGRGSYRRSAQSTT